MSTAVSFLRADDIHARVHWPTVLAQLGIADQFLRLRKPGPCPACGGHDRYVFDNRKGRGDFFCRGCGAGDGFELLRRVYGWDFGETRRRVLGVVGLEAASHMPIAHGCVARAAEISPTPLHPYRSPSRVLAVVRSACSVADCRDAVAYLNSRGLWPLPADCSLRAHPALEYWQEGKRTLYPGLVSEVRNVAGAFVTVHVTYLVGGEKIPGDAPRKMLSGTAGREGCAAQLLPATEVLGIAEGIETALSAAALQGVPVWAALNTSLLAKFEPPAGIKLLHIFADNDQAGLKAAGQLMERLKGRVGLELHVPPAQCKDFNDILTNRG